MAEQGNQDAFRLIQDDGRVARSARMLDEAGRLTSSQRVDIIDRCLQYVREHETTQAAIARELGISDTTLSELLRNHWKGKAGDQHLARLHNWMELAVRREGAAVRSKTFVETSVAREVLDVARIVAETCKMGVVFGPAYPG